MPRPILLLAVLAACARAADPPPASAALELKRLLAAADRNADGRITVRDEAGGGPLRFVARTREGPVALEGAEALARLSDLLALVPDGALPDRAALALPREQVVRELVR